MHFSLRFCWRLLTLKWKEEILGFFSFSTRSLHRSWGCKRRQLVAFMYVLLIIMKRQIIKSHSKEGDYTGAHSHGQAPLPHAQKTHLYWHVFMKRAHSLKKSKKKMSLHAFYVLGSLSFWLLSDCEADIFKASQDLNTVFPLNLLVLWHWNL